MASNSLGTLTIDIIEKTKGFIEPLIKTEQKAQQSMNTIVGKATKAATTEVIRKAQALQEQISALPNAKVENIDQIRFIAGLGDKLDDAKAAANLDVQQVGMGDKAREQLKKEVEIQNRYLKERREELKKILDLSSTPSSSEEQKRLLNERIQFLREAEELEIAVVQEAAQRKKEAEADWVNGLSRSWENYVSNSTNVAAQVEKVFDTAFQKMGDGLADFVLTGKFNFSDLARSVMLDIARIEARAGMTTLVNEGLGALRSVLFSPSNLSAFSGFVGGLSNESAATIANLVGGDDNLGAFLALSNPTPNAKGNVYNSSSLGGYSGQVAGSPSLFSFAEQAVPNIGVFGEAGAEAIMPLGRTSSGDLGVKASIPNIDWKQPDSKPPIVNIIEDSSRAGQVATRRQEDQYIIDVVINSLHGGQMERTMGRRFGTRVTGS